jgi:Periplasmic copper-binding protein (NosD)
VNSLFNHRTLFCLIAGTALIVPGAVRAGATAQAPQPAAPAAAMLIDKPGVYVLPASMSPTTPSGAAIMITASGVTLDLGGHSVSAMTPGMGRGIVVENAKGVHVTNGMVGSFGINVLAMGSENVVIDHLQVVGAGLAPGASGPTEIGINLIDTRASVVRANTISSVNLGIFIRGAGSTGNVIRDNGVTGSKTAGNNLFGICYNPAEGEGDAAPSGDVVAGNHVTRFGTGIALAPKSQGIILENNTLAYLTTAYAATNPSDTQIVNDVTVKLSP